MSARGSEKSDMGARMGASNPAAPQKLAGGAYLLDPGSTYQLSYEITPPSASGTSITKPGQTLVDDFGNVWGLVGTVSNVLPGVQITINGVIDPPTAEVAELLLVGNSIYQKNAAGFWYSTTPTGPISAGNATWTWLPNFVPPTGL